MMLNLETLIEQMVMEWDAKHDLQAKPAGSEWIMLCPFHSDTKPSFGINAETGAWHCFGCGVGSSQFKSLIWKMAREYGDRVPSEISQMEKTIPISIFKTDQKAHVKTFWPDAVGEAYLVHQRGFTEKEAKWMIANCDIRQLFVGDCRFIRFNAYDFGNTYQGWVQRSMEGDKRYMNRPGFDAARFMYGEWMLNLKAPEVQLVEGAFDYFKVLFAGFNPLAILGYESASLKLARLRKIYKGSIAFFFDEDIDFDADDLSGKKVEINPFRSVDKAKKWLDYATMFKFDWRVVTIPKGMDDPGKMTSAQIRECLI